MAKFPGPYVNSATKDDAVMKYVPMSTMDIGARPSGMPKDVQPGGMTIAHVGAAAPAKG